VYNVYGIEEREEKNEHFGKLRIRQETSEHILKYQRSVAYVQICFVDDSIEKRWFPISEFGRKCDVQKPSLQNVPLLF
jgi:hypothetical protein